MKNPTSAVISPENRLVTRRRVVTLGGAAVAATAVLGVRLGVAQENATPTAGELPTIPPEAEQYASDWPYPNGNLRSTRAASDSSITADNAAQLEIAWTFDVTAPGAFGGMTGQPIIAGDTVYVQDMMSNVFALDRATGDLKWEALLDTTTIGPNGVAIGYGLVYATLGKTGEVIALSAEDGSEVWRKQIGDPPGEGVDMAPIAYGGAVYASTVPGTDVDAYYQVGDRGVLYVLDALTGDTLWWFDTTGDNAWNAPRINGGGGLWYPPSFDDDGNIYFGTGNPAPHPGTVFEGTPYPSGSSRPGPNLYTSALVSLDRHTGGVRWAYSAIPHDVKNYDFALPPILATVDVEGMESLLAIGAGKNGWVVAVDANSGALWWRTPVGEHLNDERQELPEEGSIPFSPAQGVWAPMSYADDTIFCAYNNTTGYKGAFESDPTRPGTPLEETTGGLAAISVVDGSIKWDIPLPTLSTGGTVVANDVVFVAGLDGVFRGFDINDGSEVWSFQGPAGVNATGAIAGDMIVWPAASFLFPSVGEATPDTDPPQAVAQVVAFRLGS